MNPMPQKLTRTQFENLLTWSFLIVACIGLLLLSGCSTKPKPAEPLEQDKKVPYTEQITQKELLSQLSAEEKESKIQKTKISETVASFDWPDKDITSHAIEDMPEKVYEIGVLLPFSAKPYQQVAQETFDALAMALFENQSYHKVYVLRPIDTGSTDADFNQALEKLKEINPEVVIGPMTSKNVLLLESKAHHFPHTRFLSLNANPELLSKKKSENIWLMGNAMTNELPLLETGRSDHIYTLVLPDSVNANDITHILQPFSSIPLQATNLSGVDDLPPSARLYLPLKFDVSKKMDKIAALKHVFGFNWLNNLPPAPSGEKSFNSFEINTIKPIPHNFEVNYKAYIKQNPSSLDILAYATFQVAQQLFDHLDSIEYSLAYSTILGPVYITPHGNAHYDLQVRPYAEQWFQPRQIDSAA